MYYVISSKVNDTNKNTLLVYDILGEFKTIKKAYEFITNNGFKKTTNYKYRQNVYENKSYKNVMIWRESDLDEVLEEWINSMFNYR